MANSFSTASPGGDASIQRDRWGRPMLSPPDGAGEREPYTRVTTLAKTIEDTTALAEWSTRMVIAGLVARQDLWVVAQTLDPETDKRELNALAADAKEAAAASRKANIGTATHSMIQQIEENRFTGNLVDSMRNDIRAYFEMRQKVGFTVCENEVFVANHKIRVAGTCDKIIQMPDGKRYVADLKTGSITYGQASIAAQLAAYAIGTRYDTASDTWGEKLDVDLGIGFILHVPQGTGTAQMVPVELAGGLEAIQTALKVRQLRKGKKFCDPIYP